VALCSMFYPVIFRLYFTVVKVSIDIIAVFEKI